ncbi:MAG: hypothetical protein SFY56_15000 [Bacteroidota bacterium]|nr:hypothetical protein [Bacteroidota bacterium]
MAKLLFLLLFSPFALNAQIEETMPGSGELSMTFPSIYFKHNSTEYAVMPYSVDSCFKSIAHRFEASVNSLVIWRDSIETEALTEKRIKKLKVALRKYKSLKEINIHSMGNEQKISRYTINKPENTEQKHYLLTLNSVLDVSKTIIPAKNNKRELNHLERPRITCWSCWIHGFHLKTRWKLRKVLKQAKRNRKAQQGK